MPPQSWWSEFVVDGNRGFFLHTKLKLLKDRIKVWVKDNLGKVEDKIRSLENLFLDLEDLEEDCILSENELKENHRISHDLHGALKVEFNLWSRKAKSDRRLQGDRCTTFSIN